MIVLIPNSTAKAKLPEKLGSKGYFELQASIGTEPYFPGTAVVQVAVDVAEVDVKVGPKVIVGVVVAINKVDKPEADVVSSFRSKRSVASNVNFTA